MKESKRESKHGSTLRKVRARDVGQDGLVPSREPVMGSSNHSRPIVHTAQG